MSEAIKTEISKALTNIPDDERELYLLARFVAARKGKRDIVTFVSSKRFERILLEHFNLTVAFGISLIEAKTDGNRIRRFSEIDGKSSEYYLVAIDRIYDEWIYSLLAKYGYVEENDFVFRFHKPFSIKNAEFTKLTNGIWHYHDEYGNFIEIPSEDRPDIWIFGFNNSLRIKSNVCGISNIRGYIGANTRINIENNVNFKKSVELAIRASDFMTLIDIGENSRFSGNLRVDITPPAKLIIGKGFESSNTEASLELFLNESEVNVEENVRVCNKLKVLALNDFGRGNFGGCQIHGMGLTTEDLFDPNYKTDVSDLGCGVPESNESFLGVGTRAEEMEQSKTALSIEKGTVIAKEGFILPSAKSDAGCEIVVSPSGGTMSDTNKCGYELPDAGNRKVCLENIETNTEVRNWLVTGASSGIGHELVVQLTKGGYIVAATSRQLEKLKDFPASVHKIELDVRDEASCRRAIAEAIKKMGSIDVLVNNAGVSHVSTFEETELKDIALIMDTNLHGPLNMIKCVSKAMKEGFLFVINIASKCGFSPRLYGSYYSGSKFALRNLGEHFARFESDRMSVHTVNLGGVNTGITQRQIVKYTAFNEYVGLKEPYPCSVYYENDLSRIVTSILNSFLENPRQSSVTHLGFDTHLQARKRIRELEQAVLNSEALVMFNRQSNHNSCGQDKVLSGDETVLISSKHRQKSGEIHCFAEDFYNTRDTVTIKHYGSTSLEERSEFWLVVGGSLRIRELIARTLATFGRSVSVLLFAHETMSGNSSKHVRSIRLSSVCPDNAFSVPDFVEELKRVICADLRFDVLLNLAPSFGIEGSSATDTACLRSFKADVLVLRNFLNVFRKGRHGTILNVVSASAFNPNRKKRMHSAMNAAFVGISRTIAAEGVKFCRCVSVYVDDEDFGDESCSRFAEYLVQLTCSFGNAYQKSVSYAYSEGDRPFEYCGYEYAYDLHSVQIVKDEVKREKKYIADSCFYTLNAVNVGSRLLITP